MNVPHPLRHRRFPVTAVLALGLLFTAAVVSTVRADEPANYWLGIALELPGEGDSGVKVQDVLPGSPAAKAGLQEGDLLQEVGSKPVRDFAGLQKAIQESGGKPLTIELLRDGEKRTIKVVPAPRPQGGPLADLGHRELPEAKAKPAEPLKAAKRPGIPRAPQLPGSPIAPGSPKDPAGRQNPGAPPARAFQPLMILPASPQVKAEPFPDDLMVFIQKKGNHPAQIKVVQGKLSWNIREDQTDQLPDSIRGHVLRMLPGRAMPNRRMPATGNLKFTGPPTYFVPAGAGADSPLLRDVQELQKRLQALEDKVDALGKEAGGKVKKPDTKKPGSKKPEAKKPGTKKPEAKKPDRKKPGTKKPGEASK